MWFFFVLCTAAVGACNSSPTSVSYSDLCIFEKGEFGVLNSSQVLARIKDKYDKYSVDIKKTEAGERMGYSWRIGRTWYDVGLLRDRLNGIAKFDIDNGPVFGRVVKGLGVPESLSRFGTAYEVYQYEVLLEYPSQGVTVMTNGYDEVQNVNGALSIQLAEGMPVTEVYCYLPATTMEELLSRVYVVPPELIEMQKQRRIKWPGFGAWVPLE